MTKLIDQHRSFVEALYENTQDSKINWHVSSSGGVFTQISTSTVSISSDVNYYDQPTIKIEITNSDGEVVDTLDDNYFSDVTPVHANFRDYGNLLFELFNSALRSARGVDKILAELLTELNAKEIPVPVKQAKRNPFDSDLDDDVPF